MNNGEQAVIPDLVDGVLPDGIYVCTMREICEKFGRFQRSDQRIRLTKKLAAYVEEARESGIVAALIVDGSYITEKDEPSDVDIVIVLRNDFDVSKELRPFEYYVKSERMIKKNYRFDSRWAKDQSKDYENAIAWFRQVRPEHQAEYGFPPIKGLLRIDL